MLTSRKPVVERFEDPMRSSKFLAKIRLFALAGGSAVALSASATVAQAQQVQRVAPISQAEARQGAQYDPELLKEYGGELTGPQADYVASIGKNIAVQSGLGNARESFDVALLNSSIDNAFAIPGGYIYVTRQLVALMNNEAELAAVLGHEVGHVAARHSAQRQKIATRNQILGVLGQVLAGAVLGNSQLGQLGQQVVGTVPQLATLKYSRGQERAADKLGIQYLKSAGYDPHAMATVLQSLAAQNVLDAQLEGRDATLPKWASTHPDPASRVVTAAKLAGNTTGVTNRDSFLSRIDGLLYGDDPQQGMIEGRTFIHPVYRLSFTAPQGFYLANGSDAVSISGDNGKAQMTTAPFNGNLSSYIAGVFQKIGGQTVLQPQTIARTTVNGLPAAYGVARVKSGNQTVDVTVFAYEFANNQAFHFATLTPAGQANVFSPMFGSMRRITVAEAAQVVPRRIRIVTARPGDTVAALAARMAYASAQEQRFRVLNGLTNGQGLVAGQKYKIVVQSR
jgi:predicted Zn-dependent protease